MSLEFHKFSDLPSHKQLEIAQSISDYTKGKLGEKPQMLKAELPDIFHKYMGFIALHDNVFAGYIGATQPEIHNEVTMSEVGTLWVPIEHRNIGIARVLVSIVTTKLLTESITPYVFCNPLSEGIFRHEIYTDAQNHEVPPAAFIACNGCEMKPNNSNSCCDKVLIFKGATQ